MTAVWWILLGIVIGVAIGVFSFSAIYKFNDRDYDGGAGSTIIVLVLIVAAAGIAMGGAENIKRTPVLSKEMPVVDTLVTTVNSESDTTYRFNFYPKDE